MDEIYQAPLYKRIIAAVLDGAITILLAIGFFMLLVNGAVDIGFHNLQYKINQYKLQDESGLFYVNKSSEGNYIEVSTLKYNEEDKDEYKNFLNKISDYYFTFVDSEDKSEAYFNEKYMNFDKNTLENPVFSINTINDGVASYSLLDEVLDVSTNKKINKTDEAKYYKAIMNFFMDSNKGVYNLALTEFTNSSRFQNIYNELQGVERLEALICVTVSSLLFLALPTLINKHGETAFMHILGVCYSDSYGYKVKWHNKIIRAIVIVLLYASSAFLFAIPLLVNIIISLLTPMKRSLLDYASNMVAVDRKTSVIIDEKEIVEE